MRNHPCVPAFRMDEFVVLKDRECNALEMTPTSPVKERPSMNRTTAAIAVLALTLMAVQPAWADYQAGQRARDAGNIDEALTQWRAAANASDRRAMLALGRLYLQGLGVLQDFVEAHKWLNLAASRGEAAALKERDALAAKMTPEERAEAQKLARAWRPGATPEAARAPPAASASTPAAEAGPPPPRAIREAQALLGALGYRPGPADGIWGRRTAEAYRAFLRDAGLPAAEMLTPEALRALRTIAKRRGGAETGRSTTAAADAPRAPAETSTPRPAATRPDALHRAARMGDIEGMNAALAAGMDVDVRDERGWTALMHAVNEGYVLLVPPLLEANAAVDIRAPDGATALFMAAVHGHSEIVALLWKAGTDISIRGPNGRTAADVARARFGEPDAARKSGVDPAVLALLQGKTWAEVERERERQAALIETGAFKDCEECPLMVVVPSGSFRMGSPPGETGRYDNEGPVHRVEIGEPFAVGMYEVTVGEFGRFVGETGYSSGDACYTYEGGTWEERTGRGWLNPGFAQTEDHPVVCVNWHDAKAYVGWLTSKTAEGYRLLSESEWEYATRAGTKGRYHWGSRITPGRANYGRNRGQTASVGSYSPNGFGLHDVHGNVWEWVEDCWHDSYEGAPRGGNAWTHGGDCGLRVLRGGSWDYQPGNLRSADRSGSTSGGRSGLGGFRVARTLTP